MKVIRSRPDECHGNIYNSCQANLLKTKSYFVVELDY